ncbi:MAG: tRNA (adenosine(37)-N6)-threonylcarbamoyltransferase complex ATPase subunit type 1 TsaE [Candidatus Nitrotoga sp.]
MSGHDNVIKLNLADEAATESFAAQLSACIRPGMVIYLIGDLGAGKTTLVRALLNALGYSGRVKSPTYTLLEHYEIGGLHLRHFDLYRFNSSDEWEQAGFHDEFDRRNICLIEWPEKAQGFISAADIIITFEILPDSRNLKIRALTQIGRKCLKNLQH